MKGEPQRGEVLCDLLSSNYIHACDIIAAFVTCPMTYVCVAFGIAGHSPRSTECLGYRLISLGFRDAYYVADSGR